MNILYIVCINKKSNKSEFKVNSNGLKMRYRQLCLTNINNVGPPFTSLLFYFRYLRNKHKDMLCSLKDLMPFEIIL